jgi:hypothetical protein
MIFCDNALLFHNFAIHQLAASPASPEKVVPARISELASREFCNNKSKQQQQQQQHPKLSSSAMTVCHICSALHATNPMCTTAQITELHAT